MIEAVTPKSCDLLLILSLIRQESGFNPHAVSKAGAKGLMQIMPATWGEWVGILKIKRANPFNPIHNIMVGCAELNRQIDNFGSLELALTAYNFGSGNLRRVIKQAQSDNLEKLKPHMPKEAQEYAWRIFRHYNDPQTGQMIDDYKELIR